MDGPNRLHFYVIDVVRDTRGIVSYTVGVRSLDGAGPHVRGVSALAPASLAVSRAGAQLAVTVRNTGAAGIVGPTIHPQDASAHLTSDIYRLALAIDGEGWLADLPNALVALAPGESTTMSVHVRRTTVGRGAGRVSVTVTSESDRTKSTSTATTVTAR